MDVTCKQCGEPWDVSHVRNEAFDGSPVYDGRERMPEKLGLLYDAWQEHDPYSGTPSEVRTRDLLGKLYYDTGLAHGCTACWYEPDRVLPEDEKLAVLARALDGDVWDGDPAEFFS